MNFPFSVENNAVYPYCFKVSVWLVWKKEKKLFFAFKEIEVLIVII